MAVATYCLVALDCPDPEALATFYQKVLGGEVKRENDRWYDLYAPGGARIAFQFAPDYRPPEWPRGDRNSQQEHLDFEVTDMEASQREVIALGARPLDLDDRNGERGFRVFADPVGHPFCLCRS
ncbi:VOC family protein [Streptomyces sp. A0958]|uniref:VOC family protein n=1 Tax=Streptomyces sp. A0958 TaxID=2563101 RepID=UPI00109ECF96|nr:VOC family protein [Streptomyces sp. A0958]THA71206.1 VOC family protein [Streptomyces sp. A0958]